ncbi:MAG: O-antigen ligase family protein, partial [Candidatus Saccharimonadales bacterium]
ASHWLLYAGIGQNWGTVTVNYIMRAGLVRAAVSSGNPLVLGYLLSIALGFWLYLRRFVKSRSIEIGVTCVLLLGLIAAYSRGPWAGALVILFSFAVIGPRAAPRLVRVALATTLVVGLILISPLGNRIAKVIPFMGGEVGAYNITYRERLLSRSVEMVRGHPWFGNQNAYSELQDLRQGVGVIDFVNTYADVAVFYGLVGLALFVSFILVGLFKVCLVSKLAIWDTSVATLSASIGACIIGTLLMIYTSSFIFGFAIMFYVLGGLSSACASLKEATRARAITPSKLHTSVGSS